MPIVDGPSSNKRSEGASQAFGGCAPVLSDDGPYLLPDPLYCILARLDDQLLVVAPDVESEEVKSISEMDDTRLLLVERKPSRLESDS